MNGSYVKKIKSFFLFFCFLFGGGIIIFFVGVTCSVFGRFFWQNLLANVGTCSGFFNERVSVAPP